MKMITKPHGFGSANRVGLATLLLLAGCGGDSIEPSAAEKALSELQAKYDELVQKQLDDPAKWAADDLENIGDWEYKVQEIPHISNSQLEEALNELGDERWEVSWIERTETGFLVILKKPSVSYLGKIPLSQIGRFVIGGQETTE